MASLLNYGAGAYAGLEDIMDRDYKRQVEERLLAAQQEQSRHNQAEEGLSGRTLDLNTQLRTDAQKSLEESRKSAETNLLRDDIRTAATIRNRGDVVTPQERAREMDAGLLPSSDYKQTNRYEGMSGDDASDPVGQDEFQWIGKDPKAATGQTNTKGFKLAGKRIVAQETPDGRVMFQGKDITDDPRLAPDQADDRMLIAVQAPDGSTVLKPRGSAAGQQPPLPAAERQQVEGLDYLDSLVDETLKLGDQSGWAGVGPVKSLAGKLHDYTPIDLAGEGDAGKTLRAKIEQIRTESSFAQGGKNLTPTERAALDSFLATVAQDPATAKLRLQEYQKEARTKRQGMLAGGSTTPPPNNGGAGRVYYDADGNPIKGK